MLNLLPSIFVLGLAALAALLLALNRRSPPDKVAERSAAAHALALATVMQIIHFGEETVTGFHVSLPGMLGLPEIPLSLFITFNLVWIGLWFASVPGLRAARTFAFFAAWFLAIAGMINGIAHPLLAIAAGGYFPGLYSSPFICGAGIWLWFQLHAATEATHKQE